MKRLLLVLALVLLAGCTDSPPLPVPTATTRVETGPTPDRALLETKAKAGDYQSQRDHALALSRGSYGTKDLIGACAWRLVIIRSGQRDVNASDYDNQNYYCKEQIGETQFKEAEQLAEALLVEMGIK